MITGYHLGGLLYHDATFAVSELAKLGFESVAIRPHGASLNPNGPNFGQQVLRLADAIDRAGLRSVIDLNSPFLPSTRHERGPSLSSRDPETANAARVWIEKWIGIANELKSDLITFSTGATSTTDTLSDETAFSAYTVDVTAEERDEAMLERLAKQIGLIADVASQQQVQLGLHPRSGDAVATVAQFERLSQWLDSDTELKLAADIGEMLAGGEMPLADRLARNLDVLACVYLCDRRAGGVADQSLGQGDVAIGRILRALRSHDYRGYTMARVEGHSQLGFGPARGAIDVLHDRD